MADKNQTSNIYDYSSNVFATQSILDVFVIQDLIDQTDADRLRSRFRTNREVEDFLIKNRIVTKDTINKAYSIILKLPYIELRNVEISPELKKLIPEKLAQRFGIIPFSLEEGVIRIALSKPADLVAGFQSNLGQLFDGKNLDIELFLTGETDFREAIKQYRASSNSDLLIKKGSLPVVFLRNQTISEDFLNKIPRDFISKYRIVVFGENKKGYFLVACEQPDSPITLKILDFIKRENGIKFEVFATSKEDIDYVLSLGKKKIEDDKSSETSVLSKKETLSPSSQAPKIRQSSNNSTKSALKGILDSFFAGAGQPELTIDNITEEGAKEKQQEEEKVTQKTEQPDSKIDKKQSPNPEVFNTEDKSRESTPNDEKNDISKLDSQDLGSYIREEIKDEKTLVEFVKTANPPEIVAAILDFALNSRSSDLHVEPELKIMRVRCRIDGILKDIVKLPLELHAPIISRVKIMSKLKIDEMRIPQDGRFGTNFNGKDVDVRVSTLPTVHGEKLVMRILDRSQGILSLEDLGMKGSAFEETSKAINKPFGIILSTGPTGSGKSTTLYAILNRISVPGVNIVTLEDPVEYEISGINQCQIKPEIGFTFASGLRSILRQDPNIIMVGEIRDAETAGMATHAALTGHLVLSTLHTNDTAGALPRLINMGVEPFLITSSVNLVIAQRLVRRICPKCKEEMKVPAKLMDQLKAEISKIPENNTKDRARIPAELKLFYGKGCSECNQGFRGRVGIYEVMTISPEIEELAVVKRTANEIKEQSINEGMITMKQDGILKAFEGLTTIDEVFQAVISS